jgi:hypothetical protein
MSRNFFVYLELIAYDFIAARWQGKSIGVIVVLDFAEWLWLVDAFSQT